MPAYKFKNKHFIPALNAVAALIAWLKPGPFAFRMGQFKYAIEPTAVQIERTHQAMIDTHVLFDVEQPKDENDKRPHDDRPRKRRTKINDSGVPVFDFGAKKEEFETKFRELMDSETEITVTRLFAAADIEAIEKNRVTRLPKDAAGNEQALPPVDFSALIPFMEPEKPATAVPIGGIDDEDDDNQHDRT